MRAPWSLILVAAVACSQEAEPADDAVSGDAGPEDPAPIFQIGVIDFYGEADGIIVLPSIARAGESFRLRVMTYGGGCDAPAYLDVHASETGVELTPHDVHDTNGYDGCPDLLKQMPHDTHVVYETPGTRIIRVHGRRIQRVGEAELIELSKKIVIE